MTAGVNSNRTRRCVVQFSPFSYSFSHCFAGVFISLRCFSKLAWSIVLNVPSKANEYEDNSWLQSSVGLASVPIFLCESSQNINLVSGCFCTLLRSCSFLKSHLVLRTILNIRKRCVEADILMPYHLYLVFLNSVNSFFSLPVLTRDHMMCCIRWNKTFIRTVIGEKASTKPLLLSVFIVSSSDIWTWSLERIYKVAVRIIYQLQKAFVWEIQVSIFKASL